MTCRRAPCRVILLGFLLLCAGIEPARAQREGRADARRSGANGSLGVTLTLRGETLHAGLGSPRPPRRTPLRVGRTVLGSTIGVGVGVGIGLLLLKGADEASSGETSDWNDERASDGAATMALIGVAAMAAGGPIGAVRGAGIERNRRDVYVGAGAGELIVGLLGYALAGQLHDSTPSRLVGLGTGMAVGSAAGTLWVASAQGEGGLLRYQRGRWWVSTPTVRVRPRLTADRGLSASVALLSIEL